MRRHALLTRDAFGKGAEATEHSSTGAWRWSVTRVSDGNEVTCGETPVGGALRESRSRRMGGLFDDDTSPLAAFDTTPPTATKLPEPLAAAQPIWNRDTPALDDLLGEEDYLLGE